MLLHPSQMQTFANAYQARMLGWKFRAQLEAVIYCTFNRYLLSN